MRSLDTNLVSKLPWPNKETKEKWKKKFWDFFLFSKVLKVRRPRKKCPVSKQSGFWKFARPPDRMWCPVQPYSQRRLLWSARFSNNISFFQLLQTMLAIYAWFQIRIYSLGKKNKKSTILSHYKNYGFEKKT